MEGLSQVFDALLKQGILPAAFIIGTMAFFLALIGKIPTGNDGIEIKPFPRFFLGLFGFVFAFAGIGGAIFGIFAVTNNPPATPIIDIDEDSSVAQTGNAQDGLIIALPTPTQSSIAAVPNVSETSEQPLRPHQSASIGTGVFESVSYSDGMAQFTDSDLATDYIRSHFIR